MVSRTFLVTLQPSRSCWLRVRKNCIGDGFLLRVLIAEREYICIPPSVFPNRNFMSIVAYLEVTSERVELMWHLTVVIFAVGVARLPL